MLLAALASATTLSVRDTTEVEPGVTLTQYRSSSPATDVWVLTVDLCADGVYVDATRNPDDTQTTGAWAEAVDATAATNGDFYKTGPVRVYGDAVGGLVRWPMDQNGVDDSGEWYSEHAGWIAFLHDGVEISHTGWVKENWTVAEGWENTDVTPTPPEDTLALVSGFPEVVVEGTPMVCDDPEASDCFPDRSDMRDRHPRSAMGLSQDRSTFYLLVADGRTSDSAGLYGSELADIMGQIGAWTAFNLDGGGSSQLWVDGDYQNDTSGNNSGSSNREVANHWGVYAGGRGWLPSRPGHCATAPPCGTVPPEGGVVDDAGACFRTFGPQEYWRTDDVGNDGGLHWTNAWDADEPGNLATWQLVLEEAGDYEVAMWAEPTRSVHDDVNYSVHAAGVTSEVQVDPTVGGWVSLGTWTFAAGGAQWVMVTDDEASSPGSDQHIAADAIRLTRVGAWCGDGVCDVGEPCVCDDCPVGAEVDNGVDDDCDGEVDEHSADTGGVGDSGDTDNTVDTAGFTDGPGEARRLSEIGCGCGTGAPAVLVLLGLVRRRSPRGGLGAGT